MGLYNFLPRFVPFILDGRKTHTIRAERRYPDKPGTTLHLYTGLRTKRAKLLMRVECVAVEEIEILTIEKYGGHPYVFVGGLGLNHSEKEQLARRDGFHDFTEMIAFWEARLPFKGHIIHWKTKKAG